jgi:hypothetical protein
MFFDDRTAALINKLWCHALFIQVGIPAGVNTGCVYSHYVELLYTYHRLIACHQWLCRAPNNSTELQAIRSTDATKIGAQAGWQVRHETHDGCHRHKCKHMRPAD